MEQSRFRPIFALVVILILFIVTSVGIARVAGQISRSAASTATTFATAIATAPPASLSTASPATGPLPIHIAGTQIVDSQHHVVRLVGANHSSFEYDCNGDGHFGPADFASMRSWGMNVVRIPLSSEYWANHDNTCPLYHILINQAVMNAEAAGMYVILDLQWSAPLDTAWDRSHGGGQCPMPDIAQDVAFWRDVATQYKNDQRVIFDLYGEPYGISWEVWYNGGGISAGCTLFQGASSTIEPGTYQAIGMKQLAADVRAIAPNNILMIGGINWGYDLSAVAPRYLIPTTNVLYDTHPFNYSNKQPANWPHDFGTFATTHAVIAGEFGTYDCQTGYVAQAIDFFNAHHMSWLAWNWLPGPCGQPSLLADWDGTPTTPYGAYIKAQIQALTQSTH